jgi:diaminohydroxyphosphoribosylaminopyrimidine deaminase/5-amino-6-(5-phosphoribosylamino)uracil reductase
VVIATTDNNAMVSGRGVERMRAAGIEVKIGVLEDEAYRLNRHFFTFHGKGRPYVTLKWAQSADGFIDIIRDGGTAQAISNSASAMAVHKLRAMHDAILVGRRTALLDNPTLTVRSWSGRSPLRLVIDREGSLPASLHLFDGDHPTIIFTERTDKAKCVNNVIQHKLDFSGDILDGIMDYLYANKIGSLLVEGGAQLLQSFIDKDLWDEIRIETNQGLVLSNGVPAPILPADVKKEVSNCFGNVITTISR